MNNRVRYSVMEKGYVYDRVCRCYWGVYIVVEASDDINGSRYTWYSKGCKLFMKECRSRVHVGSE